MLTRLKLFLFYVYAEFFINRSSLPSLDFKKLSINVKFFEPLLRTQVGKSYSLPTALSVSEVDQNTYILPAAILFFFSTICVLLCLQILTRSKVSPATPKCFDATLIKFYV